MEDNKIILGSEAIKLLNTQDNTVILSIALGEHRAIAGVKENLVYVEGLGATHIYNISHIKINKELYTIDWSI
jgi:hypothetical protein